MHLQENILYELDLGVKVTQNVAQYCPHHMTYAPAKFEDAKCTVQEEVHLQESTSFDLDLRVKVRKNVAKYPPHHVIYAPAKFEVATSNGLGGYAFTRKYII